MSPEAQRIAIAEACGWVREYADVQTWDASLKNYNGGYKPVNTLLFRREGNRFLTENLPNYLTDLNAMHEAEKVLNGGMRSKYDAELTLICSRDYNFIWESTAAQRAEAFLRTVGKWEEGK